MTSTFILIFYNILQNFTILRSNSVAENDFFFFFETSQHWLSSIDLTIAHFPLCPNFWWTQPLVFHICHQLLMNTTLGVSYFLHGCMFYTVNVLHNQCLRKTDFKTLHIVFSSSIFGWWFLVFYISTTKVSMGVCFTRLIVHDN